MRWDRAGFHIRHGREIIIKYYVVLRNDPIWIVLAFYKADYNRIVARIDRCVLMSFVAAYSI